MVIDHVFDIPQGAQKYEMSIAEIEFKVFIWLFKDFQLRESTTLSGIHLFGKGSWKKPEVGKFEGIHLSQKIFNAVLSNKKFSNFDSNFPT